jgi:hypothetical protein
MKIWFCCQVQCWSNLGLESCATRINQNQAHQYTCNIRLCRLLDILNRTRSHDYSSPTLDIYWYLCSLCTYKHIIYKKKFVDNVDSHGTHRSSNLDPSPCHIKHLPHSSIMLHSSRLDMANQPGAVGTTGTHATAWGMGWTWMNHGPRREGGNTWKYLGGTAWFLWILRVLISLALVCHNTERRLGIWPASRNTLQATPH